jgi:sugar/nucleoside kinase (ribokinase family)
MRHALREALEVTDIALPSFDDEATLWDDVDPEEAAKRISDAGVQEIAVKSGPAAVALFNEGTLVRVPTPKVSNLCDTTGAGGSFNAGYLAGRLVGMHPLAACKLGQGVAGEVIGHFGALAPEPCPGKPEAKKRGPLMFIRLAFFEGVMRLGRETDFDRYVRDTLLLARDAARLARRDHARGRSG